MKESTEITSEICGRAEKVLAAIDERWSGRKRVLAAIDGRCGAGKTALAAQLSQIRPCTVFHMDDFFLQPWQRSRERLMEPGGNVDYERFLAEILLPVRSGAEEVSYRPYDCRLKELLLPVTVKVEPLVLVEGSYSLHPAFWEHWDFRIFLTVEPGEQMRRILRRNGEEGAELFRKRWIPLEEKYFSAFQIEKRCDLCI